jgi:iron complex outermembrane receptor protein
MRHRLKPVRWGGWFAAVLCTVSSTQAEEALPDGQGFFNDLPVVLTVTRLPQNILEQPASLTVIDRRMIDASGVTEVPDLLRLVAGFQLAHAGGTRTSVTYHGMSDEFARRIQVLVDGRSIYMPANGGVDWPDVPLTLEDIDRIEVLRGPNGVAFGANSFMGVVNIITRHAADTPGTFTKVQAGGGNYQRAVVRQGGKVGDLDFRVTLEHQSDDGFDDVTFAGKPRPYSIKDDKHSDRITFRGDYRAGVNDYINIGLGYNQGPRGQGYLSSGSDGNWDVDLEPAFDNRNQRQFQQLKWRRILSSEDEFQLNFYHNATDTRGAYETALLSDVLDVDPAVIPAAFPGVSDQPLFVDQHIKAERYNLEFQHRFRVNRQLRLVWGAEGRLDEVTAEGYLGQDEPIQNRLYRLFAHTEWEPVHSYMVNLGAMVEHNDISGTNVSPRLAVNHEYSAGHAFRLSYTRAYRTPAMLEEYADYAHHLTSDGSVFNQIWMSQGGLEPERITSYELGFMGYLANEKSHYDFKLFKEEIRDMITPVHDLDFTQPYANLPQEALVFQNGDWADLLGYDLQLKLQAEEATMVSIGFSYVEADGVITNEIDPVDTRPMERYVPKYTVSFQLERKFADGWSGSLLAYSVDHQKFWHDAQINTLDLQVAKSFRAGGHEGTFAVAAHNVNNSYYDYQDEYVINPRVYASLELEF